MAILVGTMAFSSGIVPITNPILFAAPIVILPILLITIMTSIWLTNYYGREPYAEDIVRNGLKGFDKHSILYQYLLPSDHVLVTGQGIYALTTRFQDRQFKIQGGEWTDYKARNLLGPLFLYLKQERLGKPFAQAVRDTHDVQEIVDGALGANSGVVVQPAIVFLSDKATLEVIDPEFPVVYASPKKKPSLRNMLRDDRKDRTQVLSLEQLETVHKSIQAYYNNDPSTFVESEI
jgi:hypothetical protein